mmetsp:Transcript_7729/g.11995  ORF Transcript_7729/g.11995 Transcript_7729/m.11995 type:complete len:156 (-) Transcript_7729:925-1392(-)
MQSSLWVWVIWVGMAASTTPTRMVRGRSSAIGRAKSHTLRFTATNGAFQTKRVSRANTPPRTSRALANAEGKEESPQGLTIDPDEVPDDDKFLLKAVDALIDILCVAAVIYKVGTTVKILPEVPSGLYRPGTHWRQIYDHRDEFLVDLGFEKMRS